MRTIYLLFFISIKALSQVPAQIEVVPAPKTIEDFEHQYKGCLENSECDQVMGLQLGRWKDLVGKLKGDKVDPSKRPQFIELFRTKYGLPVEFYTQQKSQLGFRPLLFNSPCKDHNPKDPSPKVLKGIAFAKSLSKEKAIIWRDQTQIEVPVGDLLSPQPVIVYGDTVKTYHLPLNDQPLFIKNDELYVLREDDELFYVLTIAQNGDWKVVDLDLSRLSSFEDKRSEVTCPKDKEKLASPIFAVEFCKTVWSEDLKKTVVVKMHQGCVI